MSTLDRPKMTEAELRELRGVCEAFRSNLRGRIAISRFKLDVVRDSAVLESIVLVDRAAVHAGRNPARSRLGTRAVMTVPIRDEDGIVASVTVEDSSRPFYPASARDDIERVGGLYAPMVRACLHSGGGWPARRPPRGAVPTARHDR